MHLTSGVRRKSAAVVSLESVTAVTQSFLCMLGIGTPRLDIQSNIYLGTIKLERPTEKNLSHKTARIQLTAFSTLEWLAFAFTL
jgi:hypothetical protein